MINDDLQKLDVAAALTHAMKRLKISQIELATQAGVTQSYISQICAGKRIPTIDTLGRICGALGISLGELVCEGDRSGRHGGGRLTREETELLNCYRAMNQQNRNVLFDLAGLLHKKAGKDGKEPASAELDTMLDTMEERG